MEIEYKNSDSFWGMDEKTFLIILHVSQYAGYLVPLAGFILPFIMWLSNKDKSVMIDQQGKTIANWLISGIIYAIIGGILTLILVGFVVLALVGVLSIIFPIIGAIKSSNNEYWEYPLSIKFFN
jgi:uncharacterized Tic20 family protein